VVVPTAALQAALRVPSWVRDRLHIDVYEVETPGLCTHAADRPGVRTSADLVAMWSYRAGYLM
jgi:hypothetical protein